jgi:Leucine-rich repeat (LRR) protein
MSYKRCSVTFKTSRILFDTKDLEHISALHNIIKVLPELPSIKRLYISYNKIRKSPSDLVNISVLDISYNRIKSIKYSINSFHFYYGNKIKDYSYSVRSNKNKFLKNIAYCGDG